MATTISSYNSPRQTIEVKTGSSDSDATIQSTSGLVVLQAGAAATYTVPAPPSQASINILAGVHVFVDLGTKGRLTTRRKTTSTIGGWWHGTRSVTTRAGGHRRSPHGEHTTGSYGRPKRKCSGALATSTPG